MQVDPLKIVTQLAAMYSIPARRVAPPFDGLENFDYGLRKALDPAFDWQEFGRGDPRSYAGKYPFAGAVNLISAVYARRIEELSDVTGDEALVTEMIRDYCAYVRRYSLKGYSPAVQKVINHVNLNVAEAHTLKSLSALCHISPTYLSTLFKQETGSTLIDYINTQRVRRAAQLLESTDRTVASIAEEMGILDVNYFARIFKRTFGITPTRYRREKRNQQNS